MGIDVLVKHFGCFSADSKTSFPPTWFWEAFWSQVSEMADLVDSFNLEYMAA